MLKISNTKRLRRRSVRVLKRLVTTRGILASTDNGWSGAFHAVFGRDTAITAALIFSAEQQTDRRRFSRKAYKGLLALRKWQGKKKNIASGEEVGKIPHEVRNAVSRNEQTRLRLKLLNLWFKDPKDHLLKSWDSADSTPLWVISICRWHLMTKKRYPPKVLASLQAALEWCLQNRQAYGGWAGFIGADILPGRQTKGLRNQGWKDNEGTYQYADGTLMKHPIKDVLVNAYFWAAFQYGADVFEVRNPSLASALREAAHDLKRKFNTQHSGFLFFDPHTGLHYFAEALDGDNRPSLAVTADVGMCLWAFYGDECIIGTEYIDDVVQRLMQPDMFNPKAGIRNYSNLLKSKLYDNGYHRGPETYWPFVTSLIAEGLNHFGYETEAKTVATAMLNGVGHFNSCIEMFQVTGPDSFQRWRHPTDQQVSAVDQAWTAGAVYYVTALLP